MKKFLFIHTVGWKEIINNPDSYCNNVSNWIRCFSDWKNTTETISWQDVTEEFCQNFQYVMMLFVSDNNREKLEKYFKIVNYSKRKYKTIAYVDGVVGWQMNPFPPENKLLYLNAVQGADYIFHYGLPESESYWNKVIAKSRKTINIDRPHPTIEVRESFNITLPKQDIIFVAKGLWNINEERNIISSWAVAKELQKKTGWGIMTFASNPFTKEEKEKYYNQICGVSSVIEIPSLDWRKYISILGLCRIGIGLDCLETRGQVPLDCACLRIPLVCSGSVGGYNLFPDAWLSNCRNIDKAVEISFRIIDDRKFEEKVVNYAYAKAEEYSFESIKMKLEKILDDKI